ncbi:armadillo repeat-containing protein 3 [Protopterus annectens]|uniref:armadillo repeat-containing protein 3 n=1 Tax=Protopterus annectens TaxID=7888 RepID=UPI001CFBF196|nr:armadillo repeat-containing protein 3 [Protopterus annectens]
MGKKVKKETEPPPKDAFDPLPVESKKAATVVLMLNSPEDDILAKACEALYKFADKGDENKASLLGLGAVEPLSKLISHNDKTIRKNATMVFGSLSAHGEVRKLLRKLDVISSVIARLSSDEDSVIHEFATLCLAFMSAESTSKVQILEHGGLEPLIRLLASPDPDVKKNSVECIFHLVQDFQTRAAVRELNGIPALLELLKSEYPIIQQLALKTLVILTYDVESRIVLRDSQGLDKLIELMQVKEFGDLHVDALLVVANCLEDNDAVQVIQQTGGLQKILTFAETSTLHEVQKNAATAIAKSASHAEIRKSFHEQDVEKTLSTLLGVDNDGVKAAACLAIAVMCENQASKDSFRKQGIPQLVRLLNSDKGDVKEGAALALANLTDSNLGNASAVFENEGVDLLIRLLADKIDGAVANAATVLINMATQENLRTGIQCRGVMQAIVEPLQSTNTIVQNKAALTVAAMACDVYGRTELRNAGGLIPLINLLSSNNEEVRRSACWAVQVCANDEPTAVELCRLGALEILQKINMSASRKSNFSEAAQSKLLDSHLSIKYSLSGYLSSVDIITDGFFDLGRIKADAKVLSLEELSKQEINHKRPVLLISAKEPELISRPVSPVEEKLPPESPDRHASSSLSKSSTKEKTVSKGRIKGRKEDDKLKEEEELQPPFKPTVEEEKKLWQIPYDPHFHSYINEIAKTILPLHNTKQQVEALAKFVSEKMGGAFEKEQLHNFSWELHVSELKLALNSNVIPIGRIEKGIYYHRALLFKALADRIGISCSLVRGDYNRAWNEIRLPEEPPQSTPGVLLPPRVYIVDLMHQPGHLLKADSPEVMHYQSI